MVCTVGTVYMKELLLFSMKKYDVSNNDRITLKLPT